MSFTLREKCPNTEFFTERYFVSLRIQSECGKIRTRKDSVFGHISHRVNISQNSESLWKLDFVLSFTSMLKSPMIKILSCLLRYLFRRFDRSPINVSMFELHGGLYALKIAYFLFLMVISDNIISLFRLFVSSKDLQIRLFLKYFINPPPFFLLSYRVRIS